MCYSADVPFDALVRLTARSSSTSAANCCSKSASTCQIRETPPKAPFPSSSSCFFRSAVCSKGPCDDRRPLFHALATCDSLPGACPSPLPPDILCVAGPQAFGESTCERWAALNTTWAQKDGVLLLEPDDKAQDVIQCWIELKLSLLLGFCLSISLGSDREVDHVHV